MNNGVNGPAPVTASQFNPKPTGATATGTQTPAPAPAVVTPTPAPAPAVQTTSEVESLRAKLAEAEQREVSEKKTRIVESRQWQREKLTMGEKLSRADKYDRLTKLAGADKLAAARELFGDNALQALNELAANGGAPTAAGAAMMAEQAAKDAVDQLRAEQAEKDRVAQDAQKQAEATDRQQASAEGAMYFENVGIKDFPLLKALGDKTKVGNVLLAQFTPAEMARYRQAMAVDDVDARVAMMKTVAARLESTMYQVAELAAADEKYAPKLREKLTPAQKAANNSPVVAGKPPQQSQQEQTQPQGRRSLSNDMTGSTPPNAPEVLSDDERMKRAIAKYHEAVAAKKKA